jgi:MraZ protein
MLIGEYTHTVDEKKRISLPAKFRKIFGKKIIVTRGLDQCLFVYKEDEWAKISEKLGALGFGQTESRAFNRFILASAVEVEIDSVGRILVPEYLRDFADLRTRVVFTGVYNRVEVWNEKKWTEYRDRVSKQADMMAEKLGQIGLL